MLRLLSEFLYKLWLLRRYLIEHDRWPEGEVEDFEECLGLLSDGRIGVLKAPVDAFDILGEEFAIGRLYQLSLLLELAHESQTRSDQMAAPEVCRARARLPLRQERLLDLVDDLVENELRSYLTLMGQIQAEVDRGLTHFDF